MTDPNGSPAPRPPGLAFPTLPIVSLDPPAPAKRSQAEKYGGLFWLGLGGLVVIAGLLGWFGWSVWSMRAIWTDVYTLHDPSNPDADRIGAADRLRRDPRFLENQRWDLALRTGLPPLARYLLAESVGADPARSDPRGFGRIVARSEGWPGWLKLLGSRTLAVAASEGVAVPTEELDRLASDPDPAVAAWADYALARLGSTDAAGRLRTLATAGRPESGIASDLAKGIDTGPAAAIDAATLRTRSDAPAAATVWDGWTEADGGVRRIWP